MSELRFEYYKYVFKNCPCSTQVEHRHATFQVSVLLSMQVVSCFILIHSIDHKKHKTQNFVHSKESSVLSWLLIMAPPLSPFHLLCVSIVVQIVRFTTCIIWLDTIQWVIDRNRFHLLEIIVNRGCLGELVNCSIQWFWFRLFFAFIWLGKGSI